MAGKAAVARTTFGAIRPNGQKFEIIVEIGQPYRCVDSPEQWACPVSLEGLYGHLSDARGLDAVQALCLAVCSAFDLLSEFKANGGRLLLKDGGDVPLEAYALTFAQ